MNLGCFSVSLAVKDLAKSKAFYEALGFTLYHGDEKQGWVIMKNGSTNIGLFQGMFDKNILTFNPGWDQDAKELSSFTDVKDIMKHLKEKGIEIADNMITDPDGNQILLDQHVESSR